MVVLFAILASVIFSILIFFGFYLASLNNDFFEDMHKKKLAKIEATRQARLELERKYQEESRKRQEEREKQRRADQRKLARIRSARQSLAQKNGGYFIAPLGRPKLKPYTHAAFEKYYKAWIPTEEEAKKYKLEQL